MEILMVCLGNVCRSPVAERLLQLRLRESSGDAASIHVRSAGVRALVGHAMDEQAATELVRLGGDPSGFHSRQFVASMAEQSDLVLTATRELRSQVLADAPRALRRSFTLPELAGLVSSDMVDAGAATDPADLVAQSAEWRSELHLDQYSVPDPIGRPQWVHAEVADLIDRDCRTIASALARVLINQPG